MPLVSPRQQQGEGLLVIQRKLVRIDASAGRLLDQVDGLGEDRQVAQPEEVHFQQAGRFDIIHRPLRDDVRLAGDACQAAHIRSAAGRR